MNKVALTAKQRVNIIGKWFTENLTPQQRMAWTRALGQSKAKTPDPQIWTAQTSDAWDQSSPWEIHGILMELTATDIRAVAEMKRRQIVSNNGPAVKQVEEGTENAARTIPD